MHVPRPALGHTASIVVVLLAAVAVPACGGSSKTETLSVSETQSGPKSYSYEGLKSLSGGTVKISFTNAAKDAPHEFQLARVDSGHSASEFKAAITKLVTGNNVPIPSWLHPSGGVGAVNPGHTATATVKLPEGQYYALDTQTPNGPGQNLPPFLTQGALAPFKITSSSGASLPKTSATITVRSEPKDRFRFDVSGLKTGTNEVTFDNTSKEYHHVLAVPLLPGKTLAEAKAALASNGPPKGPPPIDFQKISGTAVVNTKSTQVSQLTFAKPGSYVLFCFLTDKDGKGKPHLLRGMLKQVHIS
jgi:plastocyanin